MKRFYVVAVTVLLTGCATIEDWREPEPPPLLPLTAEDEAAIQAIETYEFGQSREPLTVVEDMVRESLPMPGRRRALAQRLTSLVQGDATLDAKQFACRQLYFIATPENVSGIATLLPDAETSHMARYALERVRDESVDRALVDALATADNQAKIGIINSLGARRSRLARETLEALSYDSDPAVAAAAIDALAKIRMF